MISPRTEDAIELAWHSDQSAVQIAQTYGVTKWVVHRIWANGRAAGRLPDMRRDERPAAFEKIFRQLCGGFKVIAA